MCVIGRNILRKLGGSFQSLTFTEKLEMIDLLSQKIVKQFPDCVDLLTARGQAYLALDMPLYAAIDGTMGVSLDIADITSHILEIESLLSMQKIDAARERARWMKSLPLITFHEALKEASIDEKIAQKEKKFLEVKFKITYHQNSMKS